MRTRAGDSRSTGGQIAVGVLVGIALSGAPALADSPRKDAGPQASQLPEALVAREAAERMPVLSLPPPAAGERRVVTVAPGSVVELDDPAYAPDVARYERDGDDLVVHLADGGVLVLEDMLARGAAQTMLRVHGNGLATMGELRTRGGGFGRLCRSRPPAHRPVPEPRSSAPCRCSAGF